MPCKSSHLQSSTLNFLHANHLEWQQLIQHHHCIHHHLGEEILLDSNQLGVQCCGSTLLQQTPMLPESE